MIDAFIEGNKKFVEKEFRRKKDHYSSLSKGQSPRSLWITCSDSRVNPERITSAEAGEIFVHRNIGNIVPEDDLNIATVLEYAVNHLKVGQIVICGHSNCGAMKALVSKGSTGDQYIPQWLEEAKPAAENAVSRGCPEKMKTLEIENIKHQLENLKKYYMVRDAIDQGRLEVHGMYYDLETGLIEEVA
ncbi:Carbonate dehydratase [Methanolacinia petrolearia DSM 11571]|uniref:carbonic anhydrase n=1 Tax=Methanolacinia petrolearia (strain DSM 11571 / OCM 486 / SEBR 4847) TaxID=679926 RepID=E1RKG0_METP4|nr:carbonic anhydrase [Methanolacinia petrolearia]ADN35813.1 Carbonate dehydratase [Methanolacinia petrolearia DSM 11571]